MYAIIHYTNTETNKCTRIPRYKYRNIQIYKCTSVQAQKYSIAQAYNTYIYTQIQTDRYTIQKYTDTKIES